MNIIKPRQSNHHAYTLPAELNGTTEKRLYMNVAQWALLHQKAVSSQLISQQFCISVRQATNILNIIHQRYTSVIQSTVTTSKVGGVIRNHILITKITPKKRRRYTPPKKDILHDNSNLNGWKSAFLMGSKSKIEKFKIPETPYSVKNTRSP